MHKNRAIFTRLETSWEWLIQRILNVIFLFNFMTGGNSKEGEYVPRMC